MVAQHFLAYFSFVKVCVDFRCRDILMTKKRLYHAQVGAAFEQSGGKGVAQGVRADSLGDACFNGLPLYHDENHGACQLTSTAVEENEVAASWLYLHKVAVDEPKLQLFYCLFGNWDETFLGALAHDAYELFVEIEP